MIAVALTLLAGCGGGGNGSKMVSSGTPTAPQDPALPEETALARIIESHTQQSRKAWRRNGILAGVARAHAEDFARRGYFTSVNPEGIGPNERVRRAGYQLPANYSHDITANEVESIGAATTDAQTVFDALVKRLNSRRQLLGETPFFAQQVEYGIGYCHDDASQYKDYWVIITAMPPRP